MAETISQSEAARRAGVSRTNIQKQLKVGRIQSAGKNKVDLASFNTWLASKQDIDQNTELSQTGIIPYDPSLPVFKNLQDAELYKTSYEARLKQLDYDLKSGAVVRIEDVVDALSSQLSAIRTRLLAIPAEMAPQIFNCKTVAETQGKMHQLMVRALEELSEDERWIQHLQERENSFLENTSESTTA
ncbi:unnamed protein product [Commensalibacter communis]|uniref:Phage terminase Nu1 subunit (DNA packaging protein) n=1 Tax=Commensalibacter communis TaxID=2972786 RepID=A0A9W4XIJ9_9PROT|nr:hypothetical protein [Commensalibacter communis]CAI3953714.1 unnamed protein product [Commensalibacter communis]CAI3956471.1 unnamed protein product [Commensalibacter communis]CAI3956788.1 unnamed protein product [Commensalibacter communis]CAI3956868.1 unnamed protein product [Commensalibacter communis]